MTEQEFDDLIRRAILDSIELEQEQLEMQEEAEEIIPFQPSARHRRQIKAMLANPLRWARRKKQPVWKRIAQCAAMLVLVGTLGFFALGIFAPDVQAGVLRWVIERTGNQVNYEFGGEPLSGEMPKYEITELPEGYAETEVRYQPPLPVYSITYGNGNEEEDIYFSYTYMQQGGAMGYDLDETDTTMDITVNGLEGLLVKNSIPGKRNAITWIDSKNNIVFTIDSYFFNATEILHMAESVSLVKMLK